MIAEALIPSVPIRFAPSTFLVLDGPAAAWRDMKAGDHLVQFYETEDSVVESVVDNELVANALKHGKNSAELELKVQNAQVILEIYDNGPGFPTGISALASAKTDLKLVVSLEVTDLQGEALFDNRSEGGARVRISFALPELRD